MRRPVTGSSFRELAAEAAVRLEAAGVEDPRREAWLLLQAASGRSRLNLIAHGEDVPDQAVVARFEAMLARRIAREPLAYILGEREFWSLTFRVGPGVLVPRPETETVVEAVLDRLTDRRGRLRLLDLGTGSGCLLLALLSELPDATGVGIDLDPAGVRCARENALRLGFGARTLIVQGTWGEALGGPFDLIVGNPPYVRHGDWSDLAPEIRAYEPRDALLAGADGLDAYRALAPDLARLLASDGIACLEHGYDQADAVAAILRRVGLREVERRRDLAGHERALLVVK